MVSAATDLGASPEHAGGPSRTYRESLDPGCLARISDHAEKIVVGLPHQGAFSFGNRKNYEKEQRDKHDKA